MSIAEPLIAAAAIIFTSFLNKIYNNDSGLLHSFPDPQV